MLDLQPPSFEAFEREARQGNVVPVVRSVLADLHTPVGTFMRIAGDSSYSFLLESVEGGERIARYSFLGAEPEMIVRGKGMQTIVERDGHTQPLDPPTDAVWMFYRNVIAYDRVKQRLEIVSIIFTEEAGGSHER